MYIPAGSVEMFETRPWPVQARATWSRSNGAQELASALDGCKESVQICAKTCDSIHLTILVTVQHSNMAINC